MTVYYNEWEKYPAEWLRNLMLVDEIPFGSVDETDIRKINPDDLKDYTQCHFFAGIGGWPLALKLAGWPKDREVWTGSCPCQPFSAAGKQKGFEDERHLWPNFRDLIAKRRPATIFGEQVATATTWLGLVRSDLEALGYAVGCMPIEAANAGADHLRDRFWFVAHQDIGGPSRQGVRSQQPRRAEVKCPSKNNNLADDDGARPQGWPLLPECTGQGVVGEDGLANAYQSGESKGREQRSRELSRTSGNTQTYFSSSMENGESIRWREGRAESAGQQRRFSTAVSSIPEYEWVVGADGKARRVGTGIRLLAYGVPQRVAKLRAFGNAIDPRPAAAFIEAFLQTEQERFL